MSEPNYRMERIERLLKELRYEITRGMMEREIEENLVFRWLVPISRHFENGGVACNFRCRPLPDVRLLNPVDWGEGPTGPRLTIVGGTDE